MEVGPPIELPEHLQDLYSGATKNLSAGDAGKLAGVLSSYKDVFACEEMDLGALLGRETSHIYRGRSFLSDTLYVERI